MSENRKNRKEPAFLRNFTTDVLQRQIVLEKNYAETHKDVDGLRILTEELNYIIQKLNMIVHRNIPYISLTTSKELENVARVFIRATADFDEAGLLLVIEDKTDFLKITHLIDLFVCEGALELDQPINDHFNVEIIFNSAYTRMVIIDIFLDVAFFNSYSFLRDASVDEKKQFSKKKYEFYKNKKLDSYFDEENDPLDYFSFAFSCHSNVEEGDFSFDFNKYIEIWNEFISEYYPTEVHVEKSIDEQIKLRVDDHISPYYYQEFDNLDPGIYYILRLNRSDIPPKFIKRVSSIFGGAKLNVGMLKIIKNDELEQYNELLQELYIAAFKIIKCSNQEGNG